MELFKNKLFTGIQLRIYILLLTVLGTTFCNAQNTPTKLIANEDENSLLWQISGNGLQQSSYLFGTFHLLCKDDIRFSNQLKAAVGNVKEVYMEMKMDDPSIFSEGTKLMYMQGNKKLKDFYSDAEYRRVQTYFTDSLQTPFAFVEKMKPYFLLALLYPKMLPCATTSGVEEQLLQLAKQNNKPIKGLETVQFQASVFDSIPYAEQAKELLKSIDSIDLYKQEFDTMLNVYKTQSVDKIETLFTKSEFGMDEHEDILLDDRNKNWIQQLKIIMQNESVFVAVGAGHLVGPQGLIALLRKQGYTVIPLQNK